MLRFVEGITLTFNTQNAVSFCNSHWKILHTHRAHKFNSMQWDSFGFGGTSLWSAFEFQWIHLHVCISTVLTLICTIANPFSMRITHKEIAANQRVLVIEPKGDWVHKRIGFWNVQIVTFWTSFGKFFDDFVGFSSLFLGIFLYFVIWFFSFFIIS